MKKYHQLLLLILSVVSLVLLLVYRHEYNRLHYVLEVFNFFGNPCNYSDLQNADTILAQHDWGPLPIWQEYEEDSYVYSAFWNKNEAKALAYTSTSSNIPQRCFFWLEDQEKVSVGKFKYSKIHPEVDNAYFYYCSLSNVKHVPYAVSFASKNKMEQVFAKKTPLTKMSKPKVNFNSTLCVLPPTKFEKRALLEFLTFHKLIGIDSFVFYNDNIPHRLVKLLTNVSNRLGYKITFLPWNFPKRGTSSLTRTLVENDCVLRTLNESKNVVALGLNEYIVPTKYYYFNELLTDFSGQSEILSLPVQEFCVLYDNGKKPIALQNVRVSRTANNLVYNVHRHASESNVVNTQNLDSGFASIHKYVDCKTETPKYSFNDNTILKYSKDFIRSTLVQFLIHDQI